jgi:putative ferrous iron transport protein C
MLSDLRRFLSERDGMVSLRELAIHFDREESVIEGMLSHWLRKGMVKSVVTTPCDQGCGGCNSSEGGDVYYLWQAGLQPAPLISVVCSEN